MATASESVKSLRTAFSANSPRVTASRSMMLTGISVQPSSFAARNRRSPASSTPLGRTTIGCSSPSSSMLAASPSTSPMSLRWRVPTTMSLILNGCASRRRFGVIPFVVSLVIAISCCSYDLLAPDPRRCGVYHSVSFRIAVSLAMSAGTCSGETTTNESSSPYSDADARITT